MNDLHEMAYKKSRCEPQVLAHDVYRGRNYYVVSYGTHPCAYVDVSDLLSMARREREYIENAIECHGGITYSDAKLVVENKTGWYIGWDYAHCADYSGYMPHESLAKKWSTAEMVSECKRAIDQIEGLIKEPPKGGKTMSKEYITKSEAIEAACNAVELFPSEYQEIENAINRVVATKVE